MMPCIQEQTISDMRENVKKIELIEKTHIRLTIIQQQILRRQDNIDNKLSWLLGIFTTSLVAIVLFYAFGIGGN